MKKIIVALGLTFVGVGYGAADAGAVEPEATEGSDVILRRCAPSACEATGGSCDGFFCMPGCENSPLSCTAVNVVSPGFPLDGAGDLYINCTGVGNGAYSVQLTSAAATPGGPGRFSSPPDGPWTLWTGPDQDSEGYFVFNGQPIAFGGPSAPFLALDEDNMNFPGCSRDPGGPACTIVATYVQVCAEPGVAPLTSQTSVCGSGGETMYPTCVEVPVTASYSVP